MSDLYLATSVPNGLFSFKVDLIPILVAIVSAAVMAIFIYLKEKKNQKWVDSFSIAGSMLVAMASAVLFGMVLWSIT